MGIKIIVEGKYACFTNPAMKVERATYSVPSPGALEGLIKSIYWKPAISYTIDRIVVYNPIKYTNIKRNEVKDKISPLKVIRQINDNKVSPGIIATESRTQRSAMILKDVKYGIEFHVNLTGLRSDNEEASEIKHNSIITRRLKNGQYFRQPCLGCAEFPVSKIELVDEFDYSQISHELAGDTDLGCMLYRMDFRDRGIPVNGNWSKPVFSDSADAVYYRPHIIDGIINVKHYREVALC